MNMIDLDGAEVSVTTVLVVSSVASVDDFESISKEGCLPPPPQLTTASK
jgi:hypothetical protein